MLWCRKKCPLYGRCPLFGVSVIRRFFRYSIIGKAVSISRTVRYTVGVRYSECPLKEVSLYYMFYIIIVNIRCRKYNIL